MSHELVVRELHLRARKDETRSVEVVASSDAIDSYGEIVEQSWDLKRYSANPIVLYAHDSRELPIGTARDVGVVDGQLRATLCFASGDANPMAEQVWRLVQEGVLRAVSVGFYPRNARWEKRNDEEVLVLSDNELLEISVVPIPANPEALARMRALAAGRFQPPEDPMDKELLKLLGLAENATPEQVRAAVARMKSHLTSLSGAIGHDSEEAALGALEAMRSNASTLATVRAERDALASRVETFERTALIEEGIRSGKLAAGDRDVTTERGKLLASKSVEWIRGHLALALENPLVSKSGPTAPASGASAEVTLTPEEIEIAKSCGNDLEELLAAKKEKLAADRAARASV